MKIWKILFCIIAICSISQSSSADESATIQATATVINPLGLIENSENENSQKLHLRLARQGNLSIHIKSESKSEQNYCFNLTKEINSSLIFQELHPLVASVKKSSLLKKLPHSTESVVITLVYTDQ